MPRPKNPTPPRKILQSRQPPLKTRGVHASVKLEPIPFDPEVDCPPFACFNCRAVNEHLNKDCPKPLLHKYCENCGRRGLDAYECPRCRKGFIQKFGERSFGYFETEQLTVEVPKEAERKVPVGMASLSKSAKKKKSNKSSLSSSVESSKEMNAMKVHNSHSINNSTIESEPGNECFSFDDDEDLDNMIFDEGLDSIIVDEDETPLVQQHTSVGIQAFISLIEAMKSLPMETQNKIVAQFVEEQKSLNRQS